MKTFDPPCEKCRPLFEEMDKVTAMLIVRFVVGFVFIAGLSFYVGTLWVKP